MSKQKGVESTQGQELSVSEGFNQENQVTESLNVEVITIEDKVKRVEELNRLIAHRKKFAKSLNELENALKSNALDGQLDDCSIRVAIFNASGEPLAQFANPLVVEELVNKAKTVIKDKINLIDTEILKG
jgi:hypothetical protein